MRMIKEFRPLCSSLGLLRWYFTTNLENRFAVLEGAKSGRFSYWKIRHHMCQSKIQEMRVY